MSMIDLAIDEFELVDDKICSINNNSIKINLYNLG